MATYLTDDGICLRVTDFSETSQIVGMFTRRHGLVPLIAKGAKRPSKKNVMSGPLDLLTGGQVVFVPARETPGTSGAQLGTLAEWQLTDHRQELRRNLAALNAAMMCAEITTHLVHPQDPHPELFAELEAALASLGTAAGPNLARVLVAYLKAALQAAGYWPQFQQCLACGRPTGDWPMRFNPRGGGVFCGIGRTTESASRAGESPARNADPPCHAAGTGLTLIVPGRVLLALDRLPLPAALRANPPDRPADQAALQTAAQILLAQVEAVTDKPVRTRELLTGIFRTT